MSSGRNGLERAEKSAQTKMSKGGARADMINFENMKTDGNRPIYIQLTAFVKSGLASGEIVYGDELPSRRVLSALLGINPNTVQKAYAILESEGIISSHSGAKSYISASDEKIAKVKEELTVRGGKRAIEILKAAGYDKAQAIKLIEKYWDFEDNRGDER